MRKALVLLAVVAMICVSGCQKDRRGNAAVKVTTTLPQGVTLTLLSLDRPGTYVQTARTDIGGAVHFVGVIPGRYKLVFQFSQPNIIPGEPAYTYGESGAFVVEPGQNNYQWTAGTQDISRVGP